MKISYLIKQLNEIKENHGDLDVLDEECYLVIHASFETVDDDSSFPESYHMPVGFKYARLALQK